MKKLICILTAILLLAGMLFTGCGNSAAVVSSKPTANADGFYNPDQTVKGGASSDSNKGQLNVKEITATKQGDDTVLNIKLLYGSRSAGVNEAKINALPAYQISCLPIPERLVVKFSDSSFCDYDEQDEPKLSGALSSVLKLLGDEDNTVTLFFPLSAESSYKVKESADTLTITLRPTKSAAQKGYFAILDAFSDYQEGNGGVLQKLGFTPTVSSDGQTPLLISKMFKTQDEANKFKQDVQTKLDGKIVQVLELATGEYPEYSTDIKASDLADMKMIKIGDKAYNVDLAIADGTYLGQSSDGKILYYKNYQVEDKTDDSDNQDTQDGDQDSTPQVERVWVSENGNTKQIIENKDFSNIQKAQYSPSGKYIAVLDTDNDNNVMYVYDIAKKIAYNMGEEGLGDLTDDFVWDGTKDILYSVSGNNDSKQVMACDFTKKDHTPHGVEEKSVAFGLVSFAGGMLYLEDQTEDTPVIYQLNPATGERKKIVAAMDYKLSSDGKYMAYEKENAVKDKDSDDNSDDNQPIDLILLDLTNMSEKTVVKQADIDPKAYGFTPDGSRLYFINQPTSDTAKDTATASASPSASASANSEPDDIFTSPVYYYDLASAAVKLDFKMNPSIFGIGTDGKIYFVNMIDNGGSKLYTTYMFDPKKNYAQ